jgi:glutathione S-transferase
MLANAMTERVLHQFPISHFCEKARWVLDHKRLPYRLNNQLPGLHMGPNRRLTGATTVPVLSEAAVAIGGSQAIALHLEAVAPERALVPTDAAARAHLDALTTRFDDEVGPAVRRFVYSEVLAQPREFQRLFFGGYGLLGRAFGQLAGAGITRVIGRMYRVSASSSAESRDVVRRALSFVDAELPKGHRYLIDDRFSLADVTVASLLGPLVGAPNSPWASGSALPVLRAMVDEVRSSRTGRYVADCYANDRPPSCAA